VVIIISGKYIKELREKMGISQQELADRVGVTQAHIAKIEAEKVDARLSTINKITAILELNQQKDKCKNFMSKHIIQISSNDKVSRAIQLMRKYNISQLPVIDSGISKGSIRELTIIKNLDKNIGERKVKEIMEDSFPLIDVNDTLETAKSLLDFHQAVLFTEKGKINGMMTKSDLLKLTK
jgi:predicted transcriptional regulator